MSAFLFQMTRCQFFPFLLLFLTSKWFANFLHFKDIIKNADYIDIILNFSTEECEQHSLLFKYFCPIIYK